MGRILYFGILAYGHQNIGITLGNYLLDKYGDEHEVYFLVDEVWKSRLQPKNPRFKFVVYTNPLALKEGTEKPTSPANDPFVEIATKIINLHNLPKIDHYEQSLPLFMDSFLEIVKLEPELDLLIDEIKPDLILYDQVCPIPFIIKRNIPWALVVSTNPIMFGLDSLPPAFSGLKMTEKHLWEDFRKRAQAAWKPSWNIINNWLLKHDCRPLRPGYMLYESPYFNIYSFPKELDYFNSELQLPGKWLRLEAPMPPNTKKTQLDLPEEFRKLPGKLIYFSLGSLFNVVIPVFQRLLDLLEQIPHRFIVSKGVRGSELRMPKNCWGEDFLDQKKILGHIDMLIAHGGNNTLTEGFYWGVPTTINPIFCDQWDNATRLVECEMGFELDPYSCTKEDIEKVINDTLNNPKLIQKWKQAAERIQKDTGLDNLLQEVVFYLKKDKNLNEN